MKKTTQRLIGAVTLTALASTAAASEPMPKEEKRGVIIGTVVGAVLGGPVGAGAGAILGGGVFGKTAAVHRTNRELEVRVATAEESEKAARQRARAAQRQHDAQIARLTEALETARSASEMRAAPEVPIQFRTASSDVEPHYHAKLASIASAIAARPDARVHLSGYADRRGSQEYNMQLSQERVEQVRAFLLGQGVDSSQIITEAHGESKPVASEPTPENHFFDRRVVMQFSIDDDVPLAVR